MREQQRQLIRRMVANDPLAAEEFVREWEPRIKAWVAQRTQSQKVEEYAQEVWGHLVSGNWLRVLQWRGLYDDEAWHEHSLEGYLKTITIRKVSDLLDAEPPALPADINPAEIVARDTGFGMDPAMEAERARLLRAYDHCSERFNENDHLAIRLWWEGHSASDIAEQIGTNANNVYQRRHYLFKRLCECLAATLPEYFRRV